MAHRDEILAYLNDYLRVPEFRDYGPQGLQVEGRPEVRRIVTGVTGSAALFEDAAAAGADLILVHHGIFWDRESRVVKGGMKRRLELLLRHEMTLAAYHLCLDAHPEVGNNALAARGLGLENVRPWGDGDGPPIGWRGEWPGRNAEAAREAIEAFYGGPALAFLYGPEQVRSVAIVSGAAARMLPRAIEDGLDLFVTGEPAEFVMHAAREGRIHVLAAGHHATERIGIRALGDHVAARFGVEHRFIDIPNPV